MIFSVTSSTARIHAIPENDGILRDQDSELLYGELFAVEKQQGPWAYGTSQTDGYTGWVELKKLTENFDEATHIIDVRQTHLYPSPSAKTLPVMPLSFMSRLAMTNTTESGFQKTASGLWIDAGHISLLGSAPKFDLANTALMLKDTPYVYGGRSAFGIDCSGLIGIALQRHNIKTRRDSKQIIEDVGTTIPKVGPFQRNDLVYLEGHIGIMLDDKRFLNATMRHMNTVVENLSDIAQKYEGGILHVKRL